MVPQPPGVPIVYQGQPHLPLQLSATSPLGSYVMYSNQPQSAQGYLLSSEESLQYQQPTPVQYQQPLTPTQSGQYVYVQNAPGPSGPIQMMPPSASHHAAITTPPPPPMVMLPSHQTQTVQEQTLMKVTPTKTDKDDSPLASPLDNSNGNEFLYLRIPKSDLDKPKIKKLLEPSGESVTETKSDKDTVEKTGQMDKTEKPELDKI